MDRTPHRARRQRVLDALGPGSVMIVPAARVYPRNSDVDHPYRQDSDFYYLTGFDEPECVAVLSTVHAEHRFVIFCRERDREREIWDGYRAGIAGAVETIGADAAYPIEELDKRLPDYLEDALSVHYRLGRDRAFDDRVLRATDVVRSRFRKGVAAPRAFMDATEILHGLRFIKDDAELSLMRRAAAISHAAHIAAMRLTAPGRYEYEIDAELLRVFRAQGSERPAYESICGSGPNATILHYRAGNRIMEGGELLLVDAGCELGSYASDVTRTYPVNGTFSEAQRALYEIVLQAQLAAMDATKPGATLDAIHEITVRSLTAGLLQVGLLTGDIETCIASETYKRFYMHRTSHWLGMDVHDVGGQFLAGKPRVLEPGCVLTIEPGLYVSLDADVDPKWRGIGIRIEDDLVVTSDGHENLTAAIPKTVFDIEETMRR